jgi:hypothetical protein
MCGLLQTVLTFPRRLHIETATFSFIMKTAFQPQANVDRCSLMVLTMNTGDIALCNLRYSTGIDRGN